ncbi:MAG: flagella basal body P-ring formation protein FlgA [Candidatus Riflebacteria bacterium]|nr:flagella basal body P-ring formation protein FlgA [Candidatus Riflebacteria bacterium]
MISRSTFLNTSIITLLIGMSLNTPALAAMKKNNSSFTPVALKSSAVVSGSTVNADSLVRNADEKLTKELANIQLGNIPNPLGEITLDKETISNKLGDLAESVKIPENVTIKRLGSVLKSEYVKQRIIELCQNNNEDVLNFDFSRLSSSIILPGNVLSWNIKSNSSNELGMKLFSLEAETESGQFKQLIQVNVSKTIEAAELCQLVKPGEEITEDMVKPVSMLIKNEKNNTAVSYKDVIGKKLDRFKSAGTIIRNSDLAKSDTVRTASAKKSRTAEGVRTPQALNMMSATMKNDAIVDAWLIKPGDSVEFRVNSGALSLSIPAKAVSGGNSGDEIELINLKNKRRISGIITEKGIVEYAQK